MDDFIFVLVCLLWAAIKGICKLLWLIISFPFKLIKNYRDRKRWNVERTDELNKRNEKEQQKRQIVENLFQKITKDIFADYNGDYLPVKMMIYYDTPKIKLFFLNKKRYKV